MSLTRRLCRALNFGTTGFLAQQQGDKIVFDQGNTVPTDASSGYAIGCIFIHRDGSGSNSVLYVNIGSETSCNFDALLDSAGSSSTLDAAFDSGKVINGATTEANACGIGGATDYFTLWQEGANDLRIGTSAGADITIVPAGGDVSITGNLAVSGTASVLGALTFDSIVGEAAKAFAIAAASAQNLTLDGGTTGKVIIGKTSTGNIEIGDAGNTSVDVTSATTIKLISTTVAVTGDVTISGTGTFGTLAVSALAPAAGNLTVNGATGATTITIGNLSTGGITVSDNMTVGVDMLLSTTTGITFHDATLKIYASADGQLDIDADTELEITAPTLDINSTTAVTLDTATFSIDGTANSNITITTGDLQLYTATSGDVDINSAGDFLVDATAVFSVDGVGNSNVTTDTGDLTLETTTSGDINLTSAASVVVAAAGTVDSIIVTSAATAASALKMTTSVATGTVLELVSAASATVAAQSFASSGTGATGWLGATGVGMVTITCDGNLAHANASCLLIAYSGTGAATGLGTSLRITDSGATSTSYAAYISAATGLALGIAGAGTVDTIVVTSAATAASALKITTSVATGTAVELIAAASTTTAVQSLACTGTGATGWLGATGVGMVTITCDGNLAHANASSLLIAYSGTGAATGLGTSLRVVDTGATATSVAVYISAATGEALRVDSGTCLFDEEIAVAAGVEIGLDGAGGASHIAETGGVLTLVSDGNIQLSPAGNGNGLVTIGDLTVAGESELHIKGDDDGDNDAGFLVLYDDDGADYYIWVASNGDLKIHTAKPADTDADGEIVGDQAT